MGKTVACIPCRMKSSRLPGKPVIDLLGKPMFVWVYDKCVESGVFDSVVVVCEGKEIVDECRNRGIHYYESKIEHDNKTSRVSEFASVFDFDSYVTINGDEPLITPDVIREFSCLMMELGDRLPDGMSLDDVVVGSCCRLYEPSIAIDQSNIKIALSHHGLSDCVGRALYLSRSPIPYPKNKYVNMYKYTGIESCSGELLRRFSETTPGNLEICEDIDPVRWLEMGVNLYYVECKFSGVSVDTTKDIDLVKRLLAGESQ